MTIVWKDSYKIGDAEIDAQHEELFKLANQFLAANDKATQTLCAMQLYAYTRKHFEHEENLMRQIGFPGLKIHREWHNRLITRLNRISLSIEKNTLDKQELENLINEWALDHIPYDDAQLAAYIPGH